ncbi:50S ribosomal protein L11 methyltransferase [Flavicella sp.]|uniref:50S ribosomal protein L11 methyltransferase n=1 Tax=Flavicella sp. TaxID=2957742 RepID=UPI003017F3BE
MNAIYYGFTFTVTPRDPATDMLIAELGYVGFESFVENEEGVIAYIQKQECDDAILEVVYVLNSSEFDIKYTREKIEQVNWNSEWEKNFSPIQVDKKVSIRAPFHKNPNLEYDIIIEPKMSFGTGHHETTHMMVQHLLGLELKGKKTLDMGCGTGILAIFSEMKGAEPIDAIDIDNWCYLNTVENIERNNCQQISVFEGDTNLLKGKKYDVIIANINRNILLNDLDIYGACLRNGGILLLSGFYAEDIPLLDKKAVALDMSLQNQLERNKWVSLRYLKNA